MSKITGGIILVTSDNCKTDAKQLCSGLNGFVWTSDGGEWVTSNVNGRDIFCHYDDFDTKSPTVFLEKALSYIDTKPSESEYVTLEEFSKLISPAISEGWIEIACTANTANSSSYVETLRIHADGTVNRHQTKFDSLKGIMKINEKYPQ
jgi:hypothetical protein